jgi:hypothetical protein
MNALTRLPRTQLLIAVSVVILIAELFANVIHVSGETDDTAEWGGFIGLSVFGIALATLLLLVVVPRLDGSQRRTATLAFGIAAVVTVAAFWSALPFALGAAALSAAAPGDDSPEGEAPAPSSAGVLLALLAMVAAFVFCIIG